jgi:TM2 domain-containing membrane protein YozV
MGIAMRTPQELANLMAQKTDQQLLDMFGRAEDWSPVALDAARAELQKRGIRPVEVAPPPPFPALQTLGSDVQQAITVEGVPQPSLPVGAELKSKKLAYLLWFFLGWLGIHRFYCRKWVSGVLWLISFGLFGVGWGIDMIFTSEMVDEVNGLPKMGVGTKFQKELRKFALLFVGFMGMIAFFGVSSWLSDALDKRTPEQKARDEQEQVLQEYREIERTFPSMNLDGNVVVANLQWSPDEMIFIVPKTYGFTATRFGQQSASVTKDVFRMNAKKYDGHYFIKIPVKEYNGPSDYIGYCLIAIPEFDVPNDFMQSEKARK